MRSARRYCGAGMLLIMSTISCARGADQARLRADIQDRLNTDVKPGLFDVVGVKREGSAPLPDAASGAQRLVVYFNATLRLKDDYEFGGWDQLGAASLAYALGATAKGIFGLTAENHVGDLVRAYGSATYERSGSGWSMKPAAPVRAAAAPDIEGTAPPSQSRQLIDRLAAMIDLPPPGVPRHQDEIIAHELEIAAENIERQFARSEHVFTLATGPAGGEYARAGAALMAAVNEATPSVKLRLRDTAGSVENAWLLSRGDADYALVQSDVAAAAFNGQEPFDRGGPLGKLRAVGGLFPEAVHVIVSQDSRIWNVAGLKEQRVAIGQAASGSRFDAIAVLAAHDLQLSDLHEVAELSLSEALSRLTQKRTDAVFVTSAAPLPLLQQYAVNPGFRLISIDSEDIDAVVHARPGLAKITLPPNTYPQQREPVTTVASLALLVTTIDAPPGEVERVSELLSKRVLHHTHAGNMPRTSTAHDLSTLTIPLHPGLGRRAR